MARAIVKIRTYRYLHEAQVAKTALESKGIEAFIDSPYLATINWIYTSMDGIGLRVNAKDVKRAEQILGPEEKPKKGKRKTKSSIPALVYIVAALILAYLVYGWARSILGWMGW